MVVPVFAEDCDNGSVCSVPFIDTKATSVQASPMHDDLDRICIVYFYGQECPKCAKLKPFMDEIESRYGDSIVLHRYEIYHNLKNYQQYSDYCNIKSIDLEERGVPFVAIGDQYYMGLNQIEENLEPKIEEMIKDKDYVCPLGPEHSCTQIDFNSSDVNPAITGLTGKVTMPLVIGAGLIDGINPCAFAVLLFLLTFLTEISSNRRRMVRAGIAYILAVYVSYLLAGLGFLKFVQLSGMSGLIFKAAAMIAIIAGLINLKDFFWYGKGVSLQISKKRKPIIERWTRRANIPGALVLGFLVSMFELPCTGGVYLAILAMLANQMTTFIAFLYLLVYNFMFVLPLIIILVLFIRGMESQRIENWRQAKKS